MDTSNSNSSSSSNSDNNISKNANLIQQFSSQQANNNVIISEKNSSADHEQIKLLRDMKEKIRKLQQEIDEKSLIISEFKDELEQTKEQYDKLKHDNLHLIQDAKQAKILRDENDILQERVLKIDQLELDIERYKDKIVELEFFKLRNSELEDDYNKLNDSKCHIEEQLSQSLKKLDKLTELEQELDKWRNYSQEINTERDTLQARILELIDNETKLKLHNERAEDELIRLKNKLKDFQDKQEELEETNNTQLLSTCGQINEHLAHLESLSPHSTTPQSSSLASSISQHHNSLELKLELEKQKQQELCEENKQLKSKLNELRQDLACEKSINDQLSRRFKNFNCTIRNIDRNFPASVTAGFNKKVVDDAEKSIVDATKVTLPPHTTTSSTSNITNAGHDSGFLSIGQDLNSEGQLNYAASVVAVATSPSATTTTTTTVTSTANQELKSANNISLTAKEIKTDQVINSIVVKPIETSAPSTVTTDSTTLADDASSNTATTAAATTTATAKSAVLTSTPALGLATSSLVSGLDRKTASKSCTALAASGTRSQITIGNDQKVNQTLITSNQSQPINLHSLCSPTKTCEIDLVEAKIDSIQYRDDSGNNKVTGNNQKAASYAGTKEVQQQLCQLSESSSSSPSSSTPSSSASSSCSSAASSTRCSPQLMDRDVANTVVGSSRSSPSTESAVVTTKLGEASLEHRQQQQQQSESVTADRNDYSSSQLLTRNSLLNSSASGTKLASNFVRNSCPSRSINFGHSSSYLERYRSTQQPQHQLQADNVASSSEQQLHHRLHHTAFAHNFLAHPPPNTGVVAINGGGSGGQSSPSAPQHPAHLLSAQHQHQQRIYQQHGSPSSATINGMNGANGSYINHVQSQQVNYENGAHMLQIGAKLNYVPSRPNATSHHYHQQQQQQQHPPQLQHQHHHHQHQHLQHQQMHQLQHLDQSFNTMSLNRQARASADHRLASALVDADYVASPHAHMLPHHHHHHHHLMPILHHQQQQQQQQHGTAVHGVQSPVNGNGSGSKKEATRVMHQQQPNNNQHDNNNGLSPIASHPSSLHSNHQHQRVPIVWPLQTGLVDGTGQHPSLVQHTNGGVDSDNNRYSTSSTPVQHKESNVNGLAAHHHQQQQQVRHHHQQQQLQRVNTTPETLSSSSITNGMPHPNHQILMTSPGSTMAHSLHHPHHHHHHHHHHQQQQQQQQHRQQQLQNHHHRRSHNHHHHHLCQSRTMYTVSPIDSPVNFGATGAQEIIGLPEVNEKDLHRNGKLSSHQNQRNSSASESSSADSSSTSVSSSFSNLSSNESTPNEDSQQHGHHKHRRTYRNCKHQQQQHSTPQKQSISSNTTRVYFNDNNDNRDCDRMMKSSEKANNRVNETDNDNIDDLGQMSLQINDSPKPNIKHQHDSCQVATFSDDGLGGHGPLGFHKGSHQISSSLGNTKQVVAPPCETTPSMVKMSKICNTTQLLNGGSMHAAQLTANGENNFVDFQHIKQHQKAATRPTTNNSKKKNTNDCDNNNYSDTATNKTLQQQQQQQQKHQNQSTLKSSHLTINKSLNPPKKSEHALLATKSIGCASKKLLLPNTTNITTTKEKSSLNMSQSKKSMSASSSPAKMLNISHNSSSGQHNGSSNNNNNNNANTNPNSSSIWYEYGCV